MQAVGISPITKNRVKLQNSSVADHLLFCNDLVSFDDFSTLTHEREPINNER